MRIAKVNQMFAQVRVMSLIVLLFLSLLFSNAAVGQTATASWDLTSDGNPVTTGNVTASAIAGGSGIGTISFNSDGVNADGWPLLAARDALDYFEYQIVPVSGNDLTVSNISFDHFSTKKNASGSVYYSTDGFVSEAFIANFNTFESTLSTTTLPVNINVKNGETLTIRVYAFGLFKAETRFYNQNFVVAGTTTVSTTPLLILSPANIDFGYVPVNTSSGEMIYQISGENLEGGDITVVAPADFEVSLSSGSGFTNSLSLTYSGNNLTPTTIYCRFKPTTSDTDYSDFISHSGGGAALQNLIVTGTTIVDCISGAVALLSSTGVSNPEEAIGKADQTGATLSGNSGVLALDLTGGGYVSPGVPVDIYWNSGHSTQSGLVLVEVSGDASVWTSINSYPVNSGGWSSQNITLSATTRYIRFTSQNNRNVLIDAVEFAPPPTITCPEDVIESVDQGVCSATAIDLGTPATSDNCGLASVTNDAPTSFPLGTTVVTWTATDIAGNMASCTQNVTIVPEEDIDILVEDLGNSCQSGETGSKTTVTWDITKISGTNDWTFDYEIAEGAITVASGSNVAANGNTQVSFDADNETSQSKTFTITISNVQDACGVDEIDTTNNSDSVTLDGVPDTSDIATN